MPELNVCEVLEAYQERQQEAQDFIYGVRAMRKFGAFGVVPSGARTNPEIARLNMAQFLISYLRLCNAVPFQDGEAQKKLQDAIDAGHPVGRDADSLLSVFYTVSDLPLNRSELLAAAHAD